MGNDLHLQKSLDNMVAGHLLRALSPIDFKTILASQNCPQPNGPYDTFRQ
jgi:hypothetical protein